MLLASLLILLLIPFATGKAIAGRQQQDSNRGPDNEIEHWGGGNWNGSWSAHHNISGNPFHSGDWDGDGSHNRSANHTGMASPSWNNRPPHHGDGSGEGFHIGSKAGTPPTALSITSRTPPQGQQRGGGSGDKGEPNNVQGGHRVPW